MASVSRITRDDLAAFHARTVHPNGMILGVTGDFHRAAMLAELREVFGDWPKGEVLPIVLPPPQTLGADDGRAQKKILRFVRKGTSQTHLRAGHLSVKEDDPDYPALLMGNYLFGSGALSSRLGTRVRQQEGLSYSIGSSLSVSSFDQRAGLTITAICNPQNIRRVEKAVREELDRLLRDGVTKDELDQGKQGYLQAQKVGRSSDTALVGILANLSHAGRTMAFQAELEKKIQAQTPEQIVAALRKHIDPKKLVIVTAGDFETETASGGE